MAQREACMYPNQLDHYLESKQCIIERYMDDTFFLVDNYEKAIHILNNYYELCNTLNIKINKKKTKIIPVGKRFLFCKWYFNIDKNTKVTMIPHKSTIYRQRRKVRKMIKKQVNYQDIETTIISFIAYLNLGNSKKYINYLNDMLIIIKLYYIDIYRRRLFMNIENN